MHKDLARPKLHSRSALVYHLKHQDWELQLDGEPGKSRLFWHVQALNSHHEHKQQAHVIREVTVPM